MVCSLKAAQELVSGGVSAAKRMQPVLQSIQPRSPAESDAERKMPRAGFDNTRRALAIPRLRRGEQRLPQGLGGVLRAVEAGRDDPFVERDDRTRASAPSPSST